MKSRLKKKRGLCYSRSKKPVEYPLSDWVAAVAFQCEDELILDASSAPYGRVAPKEKLDFIHRELMKIVRKFKLSHGQGFIMAFCSSVLSPNKLRCYFIPPPKNFFEDMAKNPWPDDPDLYHFECRRWVFNLVTHSAKDIATRYTELIFKLTKAT